MKTIKIVIGANFGDEGKGLMTDYFANEARLQKKSCLVVCHNGGSQKGHTVLTPTGVRHIFHHFGSGSMAFADTYLSEKYIVNPIIFNIEFNQLKEKTIIPKTYINAECLLTTPFDMMINQLIEEYRGADKHGSCGAGIFETIVRNRIKEFHMTMAGFEAIDVDRKKEFLNNIADNYFPLRIKELGVEQIPEKWYEILKSKEEIIEKYIEDFLYMEENIIIAADEITDMYDYVIFEGAQGLLLDQNNTAYAPHLTPSNTGVKNPAEIIERKIKSGFAADEMDIEVCYVTRTYMTRHGAGRFDSECSKEDINADITDLTNVPNPYQDSIRYGRLDLSDLKKRIDKDLNDISDLNIKKSAAVTHINEYGYDGNKLKELFFDFKIYASDGMTYNNVRKVQECKI